MAHASPLDSYLQLDTAELSFPRLPLICKAARFQTPLFQDAFFDAEGIFCPPQRRQAVAKRRSEYFAGRYLAKMTLAEFGIRDFTVTADSQRCPHWPSGLRGSISHSNDYGACVVARERDFFAIGIDIQGWLDELPAQRLAKRILDTREMDIVQHSALPLAIAISLCFSAKESIFKGLYPHIGKHFGYSAAKLCHVDIHRETLHFDFDPALKPKVMDPTALEVHFRITQQHGLTLLAQTSAAMRDL